MVWIVIALIFLVAFGPLLWLMPTPRERRLAGLRQAALKAGMRVELGRLPRVDPTPAERVTAGGRPLDLTRECAVYQYPLARRLRHVPAARLLRGSHGVPARPGWSFELGAKPSQPRVENAVAAVAPVLEALPDDVIALEWGSHQVGGYWLEGPGSDADAVVRLGERLAAAAAALTDLDAALAPPSET